jgi:hypothetical protein
MTIKGILFVTPNVFLIVTTKGIGFQYLNLYM